MMPDFDPIDDGPPPWEDYSEDYPDDPDLPGNPGPFSGTAPRFTLHSAADALTPQPPIEWVVSGLISAGSVSLVVGEGGSKKTWCCLDMAVSVATGQDWLTRTTTRGAVLVVDEESGNRRLSDRLGKVLRGHGAGPATPLTYVSLAQFDLTNLNDVNTLDAIIRQINAELVIIDALADVMPGKDENSVKDVQPLFLSLRRVAEATQAAIVIIHHSNKGGDYRGSTAIKGAVDLMLMVKSEPDSIAIDIKTIKARDTEPVNLAANAYFGNDSFYLTPSTHVNVNKLKKPQEYVILYLSSHQQATIADIMNNTTSCSPESARRALYSLAEDWMGYVRRADSNNLGRGKKAEYALTQKGIEYANTRL